MKHEFFPQPSFALSQVEAYGITLHQLTLDDVLLYQPYIELITSTSDEETGKHCMLLATDIYEPNIVRAILLAARSASVFSQNFVPKITMFNEAGDVVANDFTIKEVLDSQKFAPLEPATATWSKFFFITVQVVSDEDGVEYVPTMNLVLTGLDESIEYAVSIVTTIADTDIDVAIQEAVMVGVKLAPAFKDVIVIVGDGPTVNHSKTVSYYFEELGFTLPNKPVYLH
jgi:hypothetical protein